MLFCVSTAFLSISICPSGDPDTAVRMICENGKRKKNEITNRSSSIRTIPHKLVISDGGLCVLRTVRAHTRGLESVLRSVGFRTFSASSPLTLSLLISFNHDACETQLNMYTFFLYLRVYVSRASKFGSAKDIFVWTPGIAVIIADVNEKKKTDPRRELYQLTTINNMIQKENARHRFIFVKSKSTCHTQY